MVSLPEEINSDFISNANSAVDNVTRQILIVSNTLTSSISSAENVVSHDDTLFSLSAIINNQASASTIDLTNSATITSVVSNVETVKSITISPALVSNVSSYVSTINTQLVAANTSTSSHLLLIK